MISLSLSKKKNLWYRSWVAEEAEAGEREGAGGGGSGWRSKGMKGGDLAVFCVTLKRGWGGGERVRLIPIEAHYWINVSKPFLGEGKRIGTDV